MDLTGPSRFDGMTREDALDLAFEILGEASYGAGINDDPGIEAIALSEVLIDLIKVSSLPMLYSIGTAEVYGSVTSWSVEYWLEPSADCSKWTVWFQGEGMDEREVKDTYPATEIFQVVTEELGVEVTTEEWQEMGLKF